MNLDQGFQIWVDELKDDAHRRSEAMILCYLGLEKAAADVREALTRLHGLMSEEERKIAQERRNAG